MTLDLDGIQNDREKEQELADEVATLTDQMNDPKTSSYEKDFVKKMLLGKQATLVEMQNDIDTEEITLKEDLEDLEERQMELNNVIKVRGATWCPLRARPPSSPCSYPPSNSNYPPIPTLQSIPKYFSPCPSERSACRSSRMRRRTKSG